MNPQLLLSTSLCPKAPLAQGSASGPMALNPRKRLEPHAPTLLSSKDPLSLQIIRHDRRSCFLAPRPDRGGSALEEGMDVDDDLDGWLCFTLYGRHCF